MSKRVHKRCVSWSVWEGKEDNVGILLRAHTRTLVRNTTTLLSYEQGVVGELTCLPAHKPLYVELII